MLEVYCHSSLLYEHASSVSGLPQMPDHDSLHKTKKEEGLETSLY